jgi:hypothetical protein
MTKLPKIEASNVTQGTTGAGGWDLIVTVGDEVGEVTLLPRQSDGRPASWGDLDNWMDWRLRVACGGNRELIDKIGAVAAAAVEASGIEPAKDDLDELNGRR